MKLRFISLMLLALTMVSCEYEKDLFEKFKPEPEFTFIYNGAQAPSIDDSVKIAQGELNLRAVDFQIRLVDKSRYLNLSIDEINGIGKLHVNDEELSGSVTVKNGIINLEYVPSVGGEHIFDLVIKDQYGKRQSKRVRLFVFDNLPPVADFEIITIGQNSPYEIEVRAVNSYDQDRKWGGKVVSYKYKIGNYYEYETSRFATIKHILPSSGTYIISLQVKDNDGAYSPTVFKEVKL